MANVHDHHSAGPTAICRWVLEYARRRWASVGGVVIVLMLRIGFDLLRPWPLKILIDNVLGNVAQPPWLSKIIASLPSSAAAQRQLAVWCVVATIILFLLGWVLGTA